MNTNLLIEINISTYNILHLFLNRLSPIASRLNLKTAYTTLTKSSITLIKFIDRDKDKLDLMAQQNVMYKIS